MTITQLIETIRDIRKSQKLSQNQFAEKIGITPVSICRTENGTNTPYLDTFVRMAEGLGYEVVLKKK
ncbi:helix-turn-helix protein [Bacillus oleivorans]|uniref:Helix-turn-helix protein n=1 Tax=Bacillus oleivorans TaxID=1448271 RepID=A0A285D9H8_9BACI|nr:helix-turn-helix transcriptional regulator [Bacillus oleivorans]SNX75908.1 helix-turn-helix protein [Bacillus oleivorans]